MFHLIKDEVIFKPAQASKKRENEKSKNNPELYNALVGSWLFIPMCAVIYIYM